MNEFKRSMIHVAILTAIAMTVIKAIEWMIPSPPIKVLVCIKDNDGKYSCSKYKSGEIK